MQRRRRIAAYGLCRDGQRVLLTRGSAECAFPGIWLVPGGGLQHAEHPAHGVVREFAEETGLTVAVVGLRAAVADVVSWRDVAMHTDRVIYDVAVRSGELTSERRGTTDAARWLTLAEAAALPLMPFTADLLDLPAAALPAEPAGAAPAPPPDPGDRRQRFGAYGLVTDPAGRILLTQIAPGYPGAGRWHLPGGGTDHGEQPVTALLREIVEESGQLGQVTGLLDVNNLHNPNAIGPERRPLDWHGVRVIYRVEVAVPTEPEVTELAGGSTAQAAWFGPAALAGLRLSDLAATALGLPRR